MNFCVQEAAMGGPGKGNKFIKLGAAALLAIGLLLLTACGETETVEPEPTPEVTVDPLLKQDAEKIRISEVMAKNRAVLRDEDGDFSDWIELVNVSDTDVELGGWRLADRADRIGWTLPRLTLTAGERLLVFADSKDREAGLHTNFSLSAGETVYLYNSHGYLVHQLLCSSETGDVSVVSTADGEQTESLYPTPGYENSYEGYLRWQETLEPQGPLVISEVAVSNRAGLNLYLVGTSDWVEIRNISDETVDLSEYFLSDDKNNYLLWRFPAVTLAPGRTYVICCDEADTGGYYGTCTDISLDSASEKLYLSKYDGTLIDYASLRDIPYNCSYGRMPGQNGWFYFDAETPGRDNLGGYRRVALMPQAAEPDGVFDDVPYVTVTLEAPGTIYYTTDGTTPNAASPIYTEPLQLTSTTVVRAINWEVGAMPSRVLTLSYILNQGHSLPVVSLVSNDKLTFNGMYYTGSKEIETPGNVAFYDGDSSFSIPCGIKMQGGTSLELPKKNMSVRFRGAYGQERLAYDLFGGGVKQFTNLLLRAGQDYYTTVFRNELCLNLALSASDSLVTQRSRYCVLYVDGKYYGIYALMEKSNEQMYADLMGYSRESVTTVEADNTIGTQISNEVFDFALSHDMTDPANYDYFCQRLDIDSMIDWFLLEGYCANSDLTYGNLRYVRSTEGDGKWRFMFYDLDAAFREEGNNFYNLFSESQMYSKQICTVLARLLKNEGFRDQMLTRAGELFAADGPLTNDKVLAEIDRLAAQVEPEVERDYMRYALTYYDWARHVQQLKSFIQDKDWRQHNIDTLCRIFKLDEQQRVHYFGK
ncbi:MAG: CotH kinase family protein [Oscillospiraceae bacterium]|nr:CotH kinase family protein [Oscillospiraceae bacterium]